MKIWLHHVNVVSERVDRLTDFFRDVMGLATKRDDIPDRNDGYAEPVSFMSDGNIQFHLAGKDLSLGFRAGQAINPVERGHIAFRTDDLAAFRRRLDEQGIPYSDYAGVATGSWHQIFFHDPEGNVIEVHEVVETDQDPS